MPLILNFFSSPLKSRSIFFWWVKSSKIAIIIENITRDGVVDLKAKIKRNGKVNAAIIELSETNLVISSVIIKMPMS